LNHLIKPVRIPVVELEFQNDFIAKGVCARCLASKSNNAFILFSQYRIS